MLKFQFKIVACFSFHVVYLVFSHQKKIIFISLQIACLLFAQEFRRYAVIAEFSATSSTLNHLDGPDDERLDLQPINGTYDFLSNITKDITAKPWDDGRKENRITRSLRLAKCEKIQNTTCFGAKIQYKFTSIQLSNKDNQENSLRKLYQLEATRFVPMCWAVIQVRFDFIAVRFSIDNFVLIFFFFLIILLAVSVCRLYAKMYKEQRT